MLTPIDPPGSRPPRVIPVVDVMGGVVVRAVGGRREEYRPLVSRLTDSTDPVEVARVLLDVTGSDILYLADLDAITKRVPSEVSGRLADAFPAVRVWADVGLRTRYDFGRLPEWAWRQSRWPWRRWRRRENLIAVIGTETLQGPWAAVDACVEFLPGLVLSLDFRGGKLLGSDREWSRAWKVQEGDTDGLVAGWVETTGAVCLLVLDLTDVGTGNGATTHEVVGRIKAAWPDNIVVAGGGVRTWDDIHWLAKAGADGVLVASALHDGTLTFPRPS